MNDNAYDYVTSEDCFLGEKEIIKNIKELEESETKS